MELKKEKKSEGRETKNLQPETITVRELNFRIFLK